MQRYFAKDKNLSLLTTDIHHIKKVMRMKVNDEIEVVYDKKVYLCKISNMDDFEIEKIKEFDENNELDIDLTVAIGLVMEQKFDFILQKLTELGVKRIIPLKMERSNVKIDDNKYQKKKIRWESICKEASEQSKRNVIPEITSIMSLKELSKIDADLKLVCSVKESKNFLNNYLQNDKKYAKMIFVIGPEGGITDKEETSLNNNGYISVSLGKRVLRVETATIYVSSVISYLNMR